ncbi:hypothetical protein HNY73_019404 [Argiope bruennichi]|uniref:Uncharacterized protein n=1 Tax=Argiope bruennichi TaxID=94029 RepID=A0A8T0EL40_ARGBR|nr:hypothetical protein HNY73_019404 [Argiope bruennichi]
MNHPPRIYCGLRMEMISCFTAFHSSLFHVSRPINDHQPCWFIRKRGNIKSSLTKLNSFIEIDDTKDSVVCQTKLDNLLKIKQNLEQIKEEYFITAEDSELQELKDSVEELEEQCERLEVSLKKILASNNEVLSSSNCNSRSNEASSKTESISFRLPEIPLPKFSGHYQDWQNFKIQFENIIDNNDKLAESQKLYYLKSTLRGAAAEIVTVEESYTSLKNALKERFDNKRLCVQSHFNDILALEIHTSDSTKGLRAFVNSCIKHVRALKNMDKSVSEFYARNEVPSLPTLLPDVKEKINFPWKVETLRRVRQKIGFKWKRSVDKRKIVMESSDIVQWRYRYLRDTKKYKDSKRVIIYLDETWIDSNLSFGKCWQLDKIGAVTKQKQLGNA